MRLRRRRRRSEPAGRRRPAGLAVSAAVAAAAALGCGGPEGPVVLQAESGWPTETLRDWATYGDQLSLIEVIHATGSQTPPGYKNAGGIIGRRVTVRIHRTLWRRPDAPRAPRVFRFRSWGWMMESDQDPDSPRAPIVGEREPRLEVGHRYLALLTRGDGDWFPVGEATMTVAADGTVTSKVVAEGPVAGAAAMRSKTIEQAARLLATTRPHRGARKWAHLSPRRRFAKLSRATG